MRGLLRHTIWAKGAIPESEGLASRELKRIVLPIFDFCVALMGLAGALLGMPSITELWATQPSHLAGGALFLGGLFAFAGIVFPRAWISEAVGKLLMIVVIGWYAGALWVLTFQGIGSRWVVAFAFTALLVLPFWNIARIGREWHARRVLQEAVRRHLQGES